MSPTLTALIIYGFWTLLLLLLVVVARGADNMLNGTPLNGFDPQGDGMFPFGQRLTRAHLNCVENLPPFIAIVAGAYMSDQLAITDGLAYVVVGARIVQSSIHLLSTAQPMVMARATMLAVQIVILIWWAYQLLS
jgi:uncharacterized MAPEG superfamily protein